MFFNTHKLEERIKKLEENNLIQVPEGAWRFFFPPTKTTMSLQQCLKAIIKYLDVLLETTEPNTQFVKNPNSVVGVPSTNTSKKGKK